jgi:hypothetical protein
MTYVEPVITDVLNADSTIQGVDKTPTNMEGLTSPTTRPTEPTSNDKRDVTICGTPLLK